VDEERGVSEMGRVRVCVEGRHEGMAAWLRGDWRVGGHEGPTRSLLDVGDAASP
jgi:hypothetical protein